MKIAISGASGEFGQLAANSLLELVPAEDVVLISRSPEKLALLAEHGVELRHGDFDDPESLDAALEGVERLLLISTVAVGNQRLTQHRNAIDVAKRAGVKQIAYTSSVGIHPQNRSFIIPDHAFTEEYLRLCGLDVTILRMSAYADILAQAIAPQAITSGQWVSHSGDGLVGFVAKEDCARSAAYAIAKEGHAGAVYEVTGPKMLSHRDAAVLASEMSGRPIEYVEPDTDLAGQEQAETWIGPYTMADLLSSEQAIREGFSAICTRHVEMITGRSALSLRQVYRAAGIGA